MQFLVTGAGSPGVNGYYDQIQGRNSSGLPVYLRGGNLSRPEHDESAVNENMMLYCYKVSPSHPKKCMYVVLAVLPRPFSVLKVALSFFLRCPYSWQLAIFGQPPIRYRNEHTPHDRSVPVTGAALSQHPARVSCCSNFAPRLGWSLDGGVPPFPTVSCVD